MNAIKLGNIFASLILIGMGFTFGYLKPQSPLNNLTDEVLNTTFQNVIHIGQPRQAKLMEMLPALESAPDLPQAAVQEMSLASPFAPAPEPSVSQPNQVAVELPIEVPIEVPNEVPNEVPIEVPADSPDALTDLIQEPIIPEPPITEPELVPAPQEIQPVEPIIPPVPAPPQSTIFGGAFFSPELNPLTGLVVDDLEKLNRRPVMIKVSNYPRYGRPHAGLSFADVVFEYYIGEEANRFLALFYSQDAPKIGPLRSGRLIDAQLTNLYQGVLSYGNADPKVEKVLAKELGSRAIPFSRSPCPAVCGVETHTVAGVFVNSGELSKLATKMGVAQNRPDLNGTYFDSNPPQSDQYGIRIGVEYSFRDRGEWHYDPESSTYLRWIEAMDSKNNIYMTPLPDRLTGEQIRFSNVIIIFAKYIEYAPTLHDVEIWNNFDGQRAVVFRDGMMIEGSWKVEDHDHPIQYFDTSGKPIPLKPGNTWIVVAGQSSTFDQTEPGRWEMMFHLP